MDDADGSRDGVVRSVLTSLRVLEELSRGPLGVSELARALGVPKTTAHRSLATLHAAGWAKPLERDRTRWVLTSRALTVGLAGSAGGDLRELARAELTALRDATGETVHLVVPDAPDLVVVARVDGTGSLRTFLPLGTRAPLHATASGRAILAAMADADVAAVLDAGLETFTPATKHERSELLQELERTRERGYGVNVAEWRSDIAAIGVAIRTRTGAPLGALAVSMPSSRYESLDVTALSALAVGAAARIAQQLQDSTQLPEGQHVGFGQGGQQRVPSSGASAAPRGSGRV